MGVVIATQQPRRYGLQIIDQFGQRRRGFGFNQQMNVIGFAVTLQQLASPLHAEAISDRLEGCEHRLVQTGPAILGHEDQVVVQAVDAVFFGF